MSLHKEIEFENDVCAHLATHGRLYAKEDVAAYDRARALISAFTGPIDFRTLTSAEVSGVVAAEAV